MPLGPEYLSRLATPSIAPLCRPSFGFGSRESCSWARSSQLCFFRYCSDLAGQRGHGYSVPMSSSMSQSFLPRPIDVDAGPARHLGPTGAQRLRVRHLPRLVALARAPGMVNREGLRVAVVSSSGADTIHGGGREAPRGSLARQPGPRPNGVWGPVTRPEAPTFPMIDPFGDCGDR